MSQFVIVMLKVIMLSIVMLNAVRLNVVAPVPDPFSGFEYDRLDLHKAIYLNRLRLYSQMLGLHRKNGIEKHSYSDRKY